MNLPQKFLFAFIGLCLLLQRTVHGVPIGSLEFVNLFTEQSYTAVPSKTITGNDIQEIYAVASEQAHYVRRRDNSKMLPPSGPSVTDTVTNEKVEEVRRNPVGFLRGLAQKFRDSYQWIKTSKGWEWVQRQGTKIGELMKKAWNWFSRVILRRKPAKVPEIVFDKSHLNDPVNDLTITDDFDGPGPKPNGKAIKIPTLATIREEAEVEQEARRPPPKDKSQSKALVLTVTKEEQHESELSSDRGKQKAVVVAEPEQRKAEEQRDAPAKPPSGNGQALILSWNRIHEDYYKQQQNQQEEQHETEEEPVTQPSKGKDKGKGRAISPPVPVLAAANMPKEADVPVLTQEEHARLDMEDQPGYGDMPGPSNYRQKAWESYNTYIRPALVDVAPAIFESDPEAKVSAPETNQATEHAPVTEQALVNEQQPVTKQHPVTEQQLVREQAPVNEQAPVSEQTPVSEAPVPTQKPSSRFNLNAEAHSQSELPLSENIAPDTNAMHVSEQPESNPVTSAEEPTPATKLTLQNTNEEAEQNRPRVQTGPDVGQETGWVEFNGKLHEVDWYGHFRRPTDEPKSEPEPTPDTSVKRKEFGPRNRPGWMTPPEKNMGFPDWPGKHDCVKCKDGNPGLKPWPYGIRKNDPEQPRNPNPGWWEWLTTFGRGYKFHGPQPYDSKVHNYEAYKAEWPDFMTYAITPTMNPLPPVDPLDEGYNPWDAKPLHPYKVQSWKQIQESAKAEARSGVTKFPRPSKWIINTCNRNKCSLRNFNGDLVHLPSRPDWALHRISDSNFLEAISDMGQYEQACKQLETEQRIMAGLRPLRHSDICSPI